MPQEGQAGDTASCIVYSIRSQDRPPCASGGQAGDTASCIVYSIRSQSRQPCASGGTGWGHSIMYSILYKESGQAALCLRGDRGCNQGS